MNDANVIIYINNGKSIKGKVSMLRKNDRFSFIDDEPDKMFIAKMDAQKSGNSWAVIVDKNS